MEKCFNLHSRFCSFMFVYVNIAKLCYYKLLGDAVH